MAPVLQTPGRDHAENTEVWNLFWQLTILSTYKAGIAINPATQMRQGGLENQVTCTSSHGLSWGNWIWSTQSASSASLSSHDSTLPPEHSENDWETYRHIPPDSLSWPYDLAQATFHFVTDQIRGLREKGFHPFPTQERCSRAKEPGAQTLEKAAYVWIQPDFH